MADVVIERLDITLEMDAASAEGEFVRLLAKHLARRDAEQAHRRKVQGFLEADRNLPDIGRTV